MIERLPFDPDEEMGHALPPECMFRPLGEEGCRPASPLIVTESLATSDEITVWALFLAKVQAWKLGAGDEAKIVWRSDGSGDFDVVAISPSGDVVRSKIPATSHLPPIGSALAPSGRAGSVSLSPDAGSSVSGTEARAPGSG